MKIAIFFDGLELPPKNGVAFRFYYLSLVLKQKGVDIIPFFCDRGWMDKRKFKKDFGHAHLFSPNVFYNNLYLVKQIIKSEGVDIIQVNNTASVLWFGSYYSAELKIPLLTEMHDCDATVKKTTGADRQTVNKMMFFQYAAGMLSHSIITMTKRDKDELELLGIPDYKLNLIPNGIDTAFFSYVKPNIDSRQLVFLGNMFYGPNANAVELLINKVMPFVNLKLVCVGMVPNEFRKKYTSKNVIFTGGIDDIRPILKQSCLAVAPIYQGSGMKVKMLNFAASGIPIITTAMGASGYPDGFAIVENKIEEYPNIINRLLNNPQNINTQSKIARNLVDNLFSWDKIADSVIDVYKNISYSGLENIIPNKIFGPSDLEPNSIVFSEHCPLPMWLEEERLKFSANVPDYIKI